MLDAREAAELLGVKLSTVYQWKCQRRLAAIKLFGRALRFRRSELLKLISDSEKEALPENKRDHKAASEDRSEPGSRRDK